MDGFTYIHVSDDLTKWGEDKVGPCGFPWEVLGQGKWDSTEKALQAVAFSKKGKEDRKKALLLQGLCWGIGTL